MYFFGLLCFYVLIQQTTSHCDLFLAPSTLSGAGRGIISGRNFKSGQQIEATMTINMPSKFIQKCQLINYTFKVPHSNYSSIIFGGGSIYNHNTRKNVQHSSNTDQKFDPSINIMPYSTGETIAFITQSDILEGQELFNNYGSDWFYSRDMLEQSVVDYVCLSNETMSMATTVNDTITDDVNENSIRYTTPTIITQHDLYKYGHCLSDVIIAESTIPLAGNGLFAKRKFNLKDIVSITPVLTLPRNIVEQTVHDSVLMNYCITTPGNTSEVTLFPLNNAAIINHANPQLANVKIEWYDWSNIPSKGSYYEHLGGNALNLSEKLKQLPDEFFTAPFAQLDIVYVATRDIEPGEELTYYYGDSWISAWEEYRTEVLIWQNMRRKQHEGDVTYSKDNDTIQSNMGIQSVDDALDFPIFRSYIEVAESFYPSHWLR